VWLSTVQLLSANWADSTAKQYTKHVQYYMSFLEQAGLQQYIWQYNETVLTLYVGYLADKLTSANTVVQYLSGVKGWFAALGQQVWVEGAPMLKAALRGVKRVLGCTTQPKRPVLPWMLLQWQQLFADSSPMWHTLWAACLVMFFCMFRKSAVCVDGHNLSSFKGLLRQDMQVVRLPSGGEALQITLRHSKTNQYGKQNNVLLVRASPGSPLCAVAAFRQMVALCPADPQQPAFCYVSASSGVTPLSHQVLVTAVKRMAAAIGLDPKEVAGHSFRRGGATFAFAAGVSEVVIQRQGGWRSMVYRDYVWTSPEQCTQCADVMHAAVARGFTAAGVQLDTAP
jgi:hypothetical protein